LLFNRQSWVGLEGSFGEVRFGRDYTPTYWNYAVFEPFYNNSVATSASTWAMCIANTCARASNSIGYRLPPNLGGVYGWAMYAFGNRASNETFTGTTPAYAVGQSTENNGRHMSVRLGYSGGPVNTAVAYGKTTYAPGTNTAGPLGIASTPYGSFTDLNGGVTYKLGSVQLLGFANRNVMQDAGALGNDATIKGWNLGAIWGVGSGEIPVSYGRASVSSALLATEPKATKWAIGYRYFLSKRTTAFAYYAHVSNSGGAALTAASFSAGGIGAVGGAANINGRSTGIEVGLDHNF
jgi:predicted porin